jgi:hypothetical protein
MNSRTATLTPWAYLDPKTVYTAMVTTDVMGSWAGTACRRPTRGSFTTSSQTRRFQPRSMLNFRPAPRWADYRLASIPLKPVVRSKPPFSAADRRLWTPASCASDNWETDTQRYFEYPFESGHASCSGDTAWFLFRNGRTLTVVGEPTPVGIGPHGSEGYRFTPTIDQGWNMVGNPYVYPVTIADLVVEDENGGSRYLTSTGNTITQQVFWAWSNGAYGAASQLAPPAREAMDQKADPGLGRLFFPMSYEVEAACGGGQRAAALPGRSGTTARSPARTGRSVRQRRKAAGAGVSSGRPTGKPLSSPRTTRPFSIRKVSVVVRARKSGRGI